MTDPKTIQLEHHYGIAHVDDEIGVLGNAVPVSTPTFGHYLPIGGRDDIYVLIGMLLGELRDEHLEALRDDIDMQQDILESARDVLGDAAREKGDK